MNPRWNTQGILERQLGPGISPAHRLDRAASGLLLFARQPAARSPLQRQFAEGLVGKTYLVLVRGEPRGACRFESPLRNEEGTPQAALTRAEPLLTFPLPLPHPDGGWRRFTVLRAELGTGRFHQIRRHFAQAGFPLLGDSRHGDRKLNRDFAALTGCAGLFLRCMTLQFRCPDSGATVRVRARWSREWHRLFDQAGACPLIP